MPTDGNPPSSKPGTAPTINDGLPPLPGIDTVEGLRRMMNKTSLYEHVLREFHQRFRNEAAQIRAALATGDVESAGRRAHSAKGLAGSVGAGELQAAAHELETGIKSGSTDLATRLERFEGALHTVIDGIAAGYRL